MEEELLSALYEDAVWAGVALYLEALYILRYFLHLVNLILSMVSGPGMWN